MEHNRAPTACAGCFIIAPARPEVPRNERGHDAVTELVLAGVVAKGLWQLLDRLCRPDMTQV